jgi:acylphosphatase
MKLKVEIHGPRVHNVGYRYFLLNEADSLGLRGFSARNLRENGQQKQTVQVLIEGDPDQVSAFREIAETEKPEAALVSGVSFEDYEGREESLAKFSFRFQSLQVSKGIISIIKMEKMQGTMLEKQDESLKMQATMLEKQDESLKMQRMMLEKQDGTNMMLEKVSVDIVSEIRSSTQTIVSEIRDSREASAADMKDFRSDLKSYLDEKLGRMQEDINRIKARIGMS